MKKLLLPALIVASGLAQANQTTAMNPMENYTPSEHSRSDIEGAFWDSMTTDLDDKDCYKRAHIWSYNLERRFGVKSSKIFIHYTDKFNRELDLLGQGGGWMTKFARISAAGDSGAYYKSVGMAKKNIAWDYHVAPVVTTLDGEKIVLDKSLRLATGVPTIEEARQLTDAERTVKGKVLSPDEFLEHKRWDLQQKPLSPEEWLEGLAVRGEMLWDVRKGHLEYEMRKLEGKIRKTSSSRKINKYTAELNQLKQTYKSLGMADNERIDMKCKKVDSIADVDKDHEGEWCYYTEAPMYYWNEIDLRSLALGDSGYNHIMAVPYSAYTAEAAQDGRNKYTQTEWNYEELKYSAGEFSSSEGERKFKDMIDGDFGR